MTASGYTVSAMEFADREMWIEQFGAPGCDVISLQQGWGELQYGCAISGGRLSPGGVDCEFGLGAHADSRIELRTREAIRRIRGVAGVDRNPVTLLAAPAQRAQLRFRITDAGGAALAESAELDVASAPFTFEVDLPENTTYLLLEVRADRINFAHADWGNLEVETLDGRWLKIGTGGVRSSVMPVSFRYGALTAPEFFQRHGWRRSAETTETGTVHHFVAGGAEAGLEMLLDVKLAADLPAAEWRLRFRNPGNCDSAPLREVRSLALAWALNGGFRLHRAKGSFCRGWGAQAFRKSFFPQSCDIENGDSIRFGAVDGRSSVDWMPYFNLENASGCGWVGAVGWSGQWTAGFTTHDGTLELGAGIENFDASLAPGEELELPSGLLIFYRGETQRGQNLLRRYLARHVMPTTELPVSNITWGGMPEAAHLERIANIVRRGMPFDCYWIDAGWYGPEGTISPDEFDSAWSGNTGCWKFNPTILPHGLRPVSDAAHRAGMKQLLWMEPERVNPGTPVALEHPEWCLAGDTSSLLLDLGNPEAWQWCFDTVAKLIGDNGLDWFRNDFNLSPLAYWRRNDAPGRCGIREVRYINGVYRLWEALLRRFPHLRIDNCASGGRRLDFAMLRYTAPLWACDMECFPEVEAEWQQHHVAGLADWLPAFGFGTQNQAGGDTYNFHSALAAGLAVHYFTYERTPVTEDGFPHAWLKARLEEFHATRHLFSGDYYPLNDFSDSGHAWMLSQFDRPDRGEGVVKVFRSAQSPYAEAKVMLRGLETGAVYVIGDIAEETRRRLTGAELMASGLPVTMAQPRSSRLIVYRKLEASTNPER